MSLSRHLGSLPLLLRKTQNLLAEAKVVSYNETLEAAVYTININGYDTPFLGDGLSLPLDIQAEAQRRSIKFFYFHDANTPPAPISSGWTSILIDSNLSPLLLSRVFKFSAPILFPHCVCSFYLDSSYSIHNASLFIGFISSAVLDPPHCLASFGSAHGRNVFVESIYCIQSGKISTIRLLSIFLVRPQFLIQYFYCDSHDNSFIVTNTLSLAAYDHVGFIDELLYLFSFVLRDQLIAPCLERNRSIQRKIIHGTCYKNSIGIARKCFHASTPSRHLRPILKSQSALESLREFVVCNFLPFLRQPVFHYYGLSLYVRCFLIALLKFF